jgi:hypothetical protein
MKENATLLEEDQTVFFTCPAVLCSRTNVSSSRDFVVPDDIWAAIDSYDSTQIMTHLAECGWKGLSLSHWGGSV